jgi:hypothetical protein
VADPDGEHEAEYRQGHKLHEDGVVHIPIIPVLPRYVVGSAPVYT